MSKTGIIGVVLAVGAIGTLIALRVTSGDDVQKRRGRGGPAAVEVGAVERGTIEDRRVLTGTLEARARVVVAANVGGRVERLLVDLADPVSRGQVVAELDDAAENQGVAESAADLSVARARLAEAESALVLAERDLSRLKGLQESGVASESELDSAQGRFLAATSAVKVAKAQLSRAGANLRLSRIRSNYTKVIATWTGEDDQRFVAKRHVAEGDTVSSGEPLITVVDLTPLDAVVYVTERDYGLLEPGQAASITTDAYPEKAFAGAVRRIAPEFSENSRQARVEIELPNADGALKPGMFVRVALVIATVADATIVPFGALTTRGGKPGVFVIDGDKAHFRPVTVGVQNGDRVAVTGEGIAGRVVTLGQQLIDDGSAVKIPTVSDAAEVAK